MRENYFLDDGAYLCTKIIIKAALMRKEGKELDELTAPLKEPLESTEIRYKILIASAIAVMLSAGHFQ